MLADSNIKDQYLPVHESSQFFRLKYKQQILTYFWKNVNTFSVKYSCDVRTFIRCKLR